MKSRPMGVTFLTGASSGIGRSLAKRIAASHEAIAVVARRKELLDSLVDEIRTGGGHAVAIQCDVTDRQAVHAAVHEAEQRLGPITTLIANAGGAVTTDVNDFRAEVIEHVLDLNVVGVANCIEAVLPGMLERRSGHLVVTSSLAAYRGLPTSGAYCAAKGGLTNLMDSLRVDLRPKGIDVTILAPGFVQTKTKKKKKNRPFLLDLETATAKMHQAIIRRKPFYAFPKTLVALLWVARALPASVFDRIVGGRGPKVKT